MQKSIIDTIFAKIKSKSKAIQARTVKVPLWSEKATLAMEVCGYCNLRCPMCSYPNMKRKRGFIEWSLFEKIVADAVENGHDIASLHFFGEPLMWPHLVKGVKLLAENNIFPRISTNGMLLSGELARQLQDVGLKEIMVTIDTLVPEAYQKIRAGGDLFTVKQNIHDSLEAAPNLLIAVQFMKTKYNRNEKEDDFYEEFGHRSNFKVEPWFVVRMNNSEDVTQGLLYKPDEVDKRLCDKLFERVDVLWDGTTVLCCLDAEGQLVTGNLNENSISYSWLGPKAMALRKKILRGEWAKLSVCRLCVADHIVKRNDNWRLTIPPGPLPSKYSNWLKEIEKL